MNSHDVMLSWTAEGDKRLQDACASGSKLQLTHMALGNASTPLSITDLKQAQEVRNVIYQVPLECVTVDREKNSVIGELILPENKKEEAIREIGVFELDTLVAVGYSSSPYRPVRQEGGALVQMVRLPLNTIPASAIETVSNVINFRESDTSYLHAAENLKDVLDKVQARLNLELGTAATRNVGTNSSELITTGDADNRYLKGSENLLSTKAELSKLTKFFNLFVGDPDVLTYLLRSDLTSDQLETWLANDSNEKKFTRLFTSSVAIQIIVSNSSTFGILANSTRAIEAVVKSEGITALVTAMAVAVNSSTVMDGVASSLTAMTAVAASQIAMNAVATSSPAKEVLRNSSTAMAAIGANSMAIAKLATGLASGLSPQSYADMTAVAASQTAMEAVAASQIAMNALVASAVALNAIVKSELACKALETKLQSHRAAVCSVLNAASSSLFTTQSRVLAGDGQVTKEHGVNTATIYIPTACYDDTSTGDTDFSVHSLLSDNKLVYIPRHPSGEVMVSQGIALRGVRVKGVGNTIGHVFFDVFTAA